MTKFPKKKIMFVFLIKKYKTNMKEKDNFFYNMI